MGKQDVQRRNGERRGVGKGALECAGWEGRAEEMWGERSTCTSTPTHNHASLSTIPLSDGGQSGWLVRPCKLPFPLTMKLLRHDRVTFRAGNAIMEVLRKAL